MSIWQKMGFFTALALLTACTAKPCHFQALAEQNQSVIHCKGVEGVAVDSEVRIVCIPSSTFVDLPTKKTLKRKKMLEFELQIYNGSDRPITFDPDNLQAVNGKGEKFVLLKADQFKKAAKRKQIANTVANVLGIVADNCSYAVGSTNQPYPQNNHILRAQQSRSSRKDYNETISRIDIQYLQEHTIFPHMLYEGSFVMKPNGSGTELVQLELYIPETKQRDQFTFQLSAEANR